MPYYPTYEEMLDALEDARLKMWHKHGKVVEYGGPEFTLYVMEGLAKMEAPEILDEPTGEDVGETPDGIEDPTSEGTADVKSTVTKSFGSDAAVRRQTTDRKRTR